MHSDLLELGWTDEHWNRILGVVTEEAQKARVAAQMLSIVGPEEPQTVAVPNYTLQAGWNPTSPPLQRLQVDSDPTLHLTTIAVNVPLRTHEVSDPALTAALGMFRRAANYVARLEDLLAFGGRPAPNTIFPVPPFPPAVSTVTGDGVADGLLISYSGFGLQRLYTRWSSPPAAPGEGRGEQVFNAIIRSINELEAHGQLGPYACSLSNNLFADVCTPAPSLVLPRDRILPFLQGPLLRASALLGGFGVVVALSGSPVELVVASDIGVKFLQATQEPRYVFRVSERVALRIKEHSAIAVLYP